MENKEFYNEYMRIFLEENSKINLISKNDEKYLWEKHVFDSLSIGLFFDKYGKGQNLLDIGTGGGFPAVPIALTYPEISVTALDSIGKKIKAVTVMGEKLGLKNLKPVCMRVEALDENFDIVTSRAVASLDKICEYALPKVKHGGYFVAYKSRKTPEETEAAQKILKKYKASVVDIIEYRLPLDEDLKRNLIIIRK